MSIIGVRDIIGTTKRKPQFEEYVVMTGKQTNPYKYLKEADLYFCASYREGFSTSCQEAALLGMNFVKC